MDDRGETKRHARVLLVTWLGLVALTVGSFWLADAGARPIPIAATAGGVLGLAVLKSHLIAGVYMEMGRGPRLWALGMSGFLLAEAALVFAILR